MIYINRFIDGQWHVILLGDQSKYHLFDGAYCLFH